MKQVLAITRKELRSYFGSPMALIFVGVFLAATLFAFFWVNAFFARGIADVRPLFQSIPILMIFLVATLTMRQWSEEQRSGTLEVLQTLPIDAWQLVLGKFLAVMALVALSLALTLFVPISVALMGNLDWGPVVGGYIAALLMAAAYTAIGLFISSRTDNQIVALILSALVSGLLYLVGSHTVTDFIGGPVGDFLRLIGSGSRFDSIERGVIDLRDLVYYLSLMGIFLVLNTVSLDAKRWSRGLITRNYRNGMKLTSALLAVNMIAVNIWLAPLNGLRADLTAQHEYSLSQTTRNLLAGLQEPLLIRGYFSQKTHPLLAPLVPTVRDMLREYEIAGKGKVTVDILDPATNPEKEAEANQTYGIQPTPLQISGQREASIINAYFDILVRYGDQNQVLNFKDLIEVTPQADGTADVHLRNLEYDLTSAVKKVAYGFQDVNSLLASMSKPVKLTLYATPNTLPDDLKAVPDTVKKVATDMANKSNGKFSFETVDPDAAGATVNRQTLISKFQLQPIQSSLFTNETYYLDMVLDTGDKQQVVAASGDPTEANIRTAIESALKRSTTGFLKVVGLWTPPATPTQDMFGQTQQPISSYQRVAQQLQQDYSVQQVDLTTGQVPSNVDVLVVVAPQAMTDKARYAIDQYLMRGGSVVVASGSYVIDQDPMTGGLTLKAIDQGLADMLDSYGVHIDKTLVMDPQNEPYPVQIQRQVGQYTVPEYHAMDYPFFVDIRTDGMDKNSPIVSSVPMVTLNWASPVTLDATKNQGRQTAVLLKSTAKAWLHSTTDIQPKSQDLNNPFPVEGTQSSHPLAVSVQGSFTSYFKGKPSPLTAQDQPAAQNQQQQPQPTPASQTTGMIEASPDTARLVVIGSSEFLDDVVFQISNSMTPNRYLNSLQFLQNTVDWSVQDQDLLSIRSRGSYARLLAPMSATQQITWELVDCALALLALVVIGVAWALRRRNEKPMPLLPPGHGAGAGAEAGSLARPASQ